MKIKLVHDHYDQGHLDQVVEEMKTMGAPTIKAVWMECWNQWVALEGCHRLRAAEFLGLTPEIEEIPYDDTTTAMDLDLDFEDDCLVSAIVDNAYLRSSIEF